MENLSAQEADPNEDDFYYGEFDDYLFESAGLVIFEASSTLTYRSFGEIFPTLSARQRNVAMGSYGLRHSLEKHETPTLLPAANSGINLYSSVMRKDPSHIIEALIVVPHTQRGLDLVDIYNTLGRIERIKDQRTTLRGGEVISIFKDTTRLNNPTNRRAIPDPPPADMFPFSETMYLRFTDNYIGNVYLRGDLTVGSHGMTYNLTNFRNINFSIFTIMRAERVSIILYIEPVKEGILIYSMTGIFLPDFIINRVNLTPNMNIRINSLLRWITEGLRIQGHLPPRRPTAEEVIQNESFNRLLNN